MRLRRVFLPFMILVLMVSSCSFTLADTGNYLDEAEQLKRINVFKGSEQGFELEREPTRLEGGIMFVKLLGAEAEALEMNYPHPFTDVPDWGDPFVGYLYEKGYTSGVSEGLFGSYDKMQAKSYMTFLLRALKYDDHSGDFSWNDAVSKSREIHMIDTDLEAILNSEVFLRDHLAKLSLEALKTQVKGEEITLAKELVDKGVIPQALADELKLVNPTQEYAQDMMSKTSILDKMQTIEGVSNYKDINGLRYYRPLTENELTGIVYDGLDTMDIYHNAYSIEELKKANTDIDWDTWMTLKWGKFDWNDKSHGDNLAFDDYWQDYDGNTPATAGTYAAALGLRVPTEEELKTLLGSLSKGPQEDLGWPSGYYWTSDVSAEGPDFHRFVDTLNKMGQEYNDTRDYFVILVGPVAEPQMSKKAPALKKDGIFATSQKLAGMKDIPGVANSISVDGVLIYRPLTTDEVTAILGTNKYDFSLPGKYGYSEEKLDEYTVTITEEKNRLKAENPNIDWDEWMELMWPLYDSSFDPHDYSLGTEYDGDYSITDGNLLEIYAGQRLSYTPKYLFDKLYEAYPNGQITRVFGWPTNYEYITSSRDEFGNVYTTSLFIESAAIHLGYYGPCYISLMNYDDIIYEKLTESSLAE